MSVVIAFLIETRSGSVPGAWNPLAAIAVRTRLSSVSFSAVRRSPSMIELTSGCSRYTFGTPDWTVAAAGAKGSRSRRRARLRLVRGGVDRAVHVRRRRERPGALRDDVHGRDALGDVDAERGLPQPRAVIGQRGARRPGFMVSTEPVQETARSSNASKGIVAVSPGNPAARNSTARPRRGAPAVRSSTCTPPEPGSLVPAS